MPYNTYWYMHHHAAILLDIHPDAIMAKFIVIICVIVIIIRTWTQKYAEQQLQGIL